MNIHRVIVSSLMVFLTVSGVYAQSTLPVQIDLSIADTELTGSIFIEKLNDRGFGQRIDSVKISTSPFVFNANIPEPGIYQLNIANQQVIGLLLDGGEKLSIQADGKTTDDKPASAAIQGSEKMVIFSELQQKQFVFMNKVKEIDSKFKATSNENTRTKIRDEYLGELKKHNQDIIGQVKSLGTSAAGILAAINFLDMDTSMEFFEELVNQLKIEGKDYSLAQILVQKVNHDKMGQPGVQAPDFELKTLDGKIVKLSDLRGKIVVLDFWATWCGPCIMSFPGMKMAMDKFADREDVAFVYVNTFERVAPEQTVDHVKKFTNIRGLSYLNTVLDEQNKTAFLYGVSSIPTKFFIDKEGKFLHMSRGFAGSNEAVVEEISLWFNK